MSGCHIWILPRSINRVQMVYEYGMQVLRKDGQEVKSRDALAFIISRSSVRIQVLPKCGPDCELRGKWRGNSSSRLRLRMRPMMPRLRSMISNDATAKVNDFR